MSHGLDVFRINSSNFNVLPFTKWSHVVNFDVFMSYKLSKYLELIQSSVHSAFLNTFTNLHITAKCLIFPKLPDLGASSTVLRAHHLI
jgi:hypothetical protein